ncbi:MAG: TonB-dependent receptor [Chitinophagaceae bacterium]
MGKRQQALLALGLLLNIGSLNAQNRKEVKGVVRDTLGLPVSGATIRLKGSATMASSDDNGNFTIHIYGSSDSLSFLSIGYIAQTIAIGLDSVLNVYLIPDVKERALNEVVVVGYGAQKKKDLTGAISSVNSDNMNLGGVTTNAAQAIQGKASGVQIMQASSEPGGSTTITIRGGNSINASNNPLYVIDGFPSETGLDINPNDIASVEILKDASAAAIYGARGANGVIIITTKRGTANKSIVQYDGYYGAQIVKNIYKKMTGLQAMEIDNAKSEEEGSSDIWTSDEIAAATTTDWFDLATTNSNVQSHNLSVRGGNNKTKISFSANYFKQNGVLKKSDYNRYSFRLNIDHKVSDKFQIGANTYGAKTYSQYHNYTGSIVESNVMYNIISYSPAVPVKDEDGSYYRYNGKDNPIAWLLEPTYDNFGTKVLVNAYAEYSFLNGLSLHVDGGSEYYAQKTGSYIPRTLSEGEKVDGDATLSHNTTTRNLVEAYVTFKRGFKQHNVNAVAGVSYQNDLTDKSSLEMEGFSTDAYLYNNMGGGSSYVSSTSSKVNARIASAYGRFNYGFKDKYLATFTIRRDGSSRFGSNHKYGTFPSGSLAWQIGDEDFMKNITSLSNLKLRASYGITGNDRISDYLYETIYSNYSATLDGSTIASGIVPSQLSNPELRWESTAQLDIGIDFGFLGNKLIGTIDYYAKKTKDLLMNIPIGDWNGFTSQTVNAGKIGNRGIEFSITSDNIKNNKFSWNTNFNISYNKQKALDLYGVSYISSTIPTPFGGQAIEYTRLVKGRELGSIFGYKYDGVIKTGETYTAQSSSVAGDPKYIDVNADGTIDSDDRTFLGHTTPRYTYGLTNTFSYSNLSLIVFFQGAADYSKYDATNLVLESTYGIAALNRWTTANENTDIPRNGYLNTTYGSPINSRFIENASYVRLKTLTLSYRIRIKKLYDMNVYFTGQNLLTFTGYKGSDPEVNTQSSSNLTGGEDYTAFPAYRIYTIGLQLNF